MEMWKSTTRFGFKTKPSSGCVQTLKTQNITTVIINSLRRLTVTSLHLSYTT